MEKSKAKKDRILEATFELMISRGTSVTLDEIAEHAGLSIAEIYDFFPTKEEVFRGVTRQQAQQVILATTQAAEQAQGASARLSAVIRSRFEMMRLWNRNTGQRTELSVNNQVQEIRYATQEAEVQSIQLILREGHRSGEFHVEDPEQEARLLVAALKGIDQYLLVYGSPQKLSTDIDSITHRILKGLEVR